MIKFFRRIRRRLLTENNFSKYLIYAIGEILLVVIGILIALSLNNRNEQKKNNDIFLLKLDIAFNRALLINSKNDGNIRNETREIQWIDSLLNSSDSFNIETLPVLLYRMNSYSLPALNELVDLKIEDEIYNNIDKEKQLLINYINLYNNRFSFLDKELQKHWGNNNDFGEKLVEWGIPKITAPDYELNGFNAKTLEIKNFYTAHHYEILKKKLGDQEFYDALITLRSSKQSLVDLLNRTKKRITEFQERIAQYYPTVGSEVLSLGIIGSSLEGWYTSVPLKYDNESGHWTRTIELKEGSVKFRANDDWDRNWGGKTFPKGNLIGGGPNFAVEPGVYQLTVDLASNTYEFREIEK